MKFTAASYSPPPIVREIPDDIFYWSNIVKLNLKIYRLFKNIADYPFNYCEPVSLLQLFV